MAVKQTIEKTDKTTAKADKATAFQKEIIDTTKQILELKLPVEANIVSCLYKNPQLMYDVNLSLDMFHHNTWKVYFAIIQQLILTERKESIDEIVIGIYLEKHLKLRKRYEEYGGFDTISQATEYVDTQNLWGYVSELKKLTALIELTKLGFPIKENLSRYMDATEEDIYDELEAKLNHIFSNVVDDVKSYNAFEDIHEFIEELNEGEAVGLPFYNAPLLNKEIGGFNLNGNIYGLGANSGVGKSTMAFNWIFPSCLNLKEKLVMIINEEDERKVKKEMIIWVANNIFKEELHKYVLRDGNFSEETLTLLRKCADWIEERKEQKILTVIPLERYTVGSAIKIIKKYSSLGVRAFILDTLKESADAKDDIYKSMMRDMVKLYDVVKPAAKNVGLFVTYQLAKGSLKMKYLTNNEIGMAKSIVDVMSVNIMMRRPYAEELTGGREPLKCKRLEGKEGKTKISFEMSGEKNYMLTFITKNRFGSSDKFQIVSEVDLSTNVYKDVGITTVMQDF